MLGVGILKCGVQRDNSADDPDILDLPSFGCVGISEYASMSDDGVGCVIHYLKLKHEGRPDQRDVFWLVEETKEMFEGHRSSIAP